MKIFLLIPGILLLSSFNLHAQGQANYWGFATFEVNFNSIPPAIENNFAASVFHKDMGVISDQAGSLLLYSDAHSIWNSNHEVVLNGSLFLSDTIDLRESIILKIPESNQLYYIFSVGRSGMYYTEVDLTRNTGNGEVVDGPNLLIENTSGRVSAFTNKNTKTSWVVADIYDDNTYHIVKIGVSGIESSTSYQLGGKDELWSGGQIKFSTDGTKVAISYDRGNLGEGFEIFEFDDVTGELSNPLSFTLPVTSRGCDGIEFSSDSKFLYVIQKGSTGENALYQYDLKEYDYDKINTSQRKLGYPTIAQISKMQIATDGNIYISKGGGHENGKWYLGMIQNANDRSEASFVELGLHLEGTSVSRAIPNFDQNLFFKTSFSFEGSCQDWPTNFTVTNTHQLQSVNWDFGEGSSSTEFNPEFTYSVADTYTVTLTANYSDRTDIITKEVTIDPIPILDLGDNQQLCFGSKLMVGDNYTSYFWNTGDTTNTTIVDISGYYVLEVTNAFGCTTKDSLFVDIIDLPRIVLADTISIASGPVVVDPGVFDSYSWSTGEDTPSIEISKTGWYSILVANASGCESSKSFYVSNGSGSVPEMTKWTRLSPTPSALKGKDIAFVNESIGFIVNDQELLTTKDLGNTWDKFMLINRGNRIAFKNGYGYIIGSEGDVYKSTYNGGGWNRLKTNLADNLNGITILDPDTLFVTSDTRLYKSFDGGVSWESLGINGVDVEDSYFINDSVGHVACRNGTILKTINGGDTWYQTESSNSSSSDFFKITFIDDLVGYATRKFNYVYKTIDGGETWNQIASLNEGFALHFVNENVGFQAGEGGSIYKTIDGGDTWSWISYNNRSGNDLFSIYFFDENVGFSTGSKGRIIRTFDGGNSWEGYSPTYNTISEIELGSSNYLYALVNNEIFKSDDKGKQWTNLESISSGEKTSKIDFINANVGFALVGGTPGTSGQSNKIYKTSDGGLTWVQQNSESFHNALEAINFIDENLGFVSTTSGAIFKSTNSGGSWSQVNHSGNRIKEFQFTSSQIGYAINTGNYYGRIYKTVDGGENWTLNYENGGSEIQAIHFINSEIGFIVGDRDLRLTKTSNGGSSWERIEVPYEWYEDVYFHNESYGFICDDEGRVLETSDGGISWERIESLSGISQLKANDNEIYAYGEGGNILKSSITLGDQVNFGDIQISNLRNTKATVAIELFSNIPGTEVFLEYGESETTLEEIKSNEFTGAISISLGDLKEETTYYSRYVVKKDNESAYSPTTSFTTLSFYDLITIGELSISATDNESATIEFTIRSLLESSELYLDLGQTSENYTREDLINSWSEEIDQTINYTISDLTPSSTYFIRIRIKSGENSLVGIESSFNTIDEILNAEELDNKVFVYPNPTKNRFWIKDDVSFTSLQLLDLSGHEIQEVPPETRSLDLTNLPNGAYQLIFHFADYQKAILILKK